MSITIESIAEIKDQLKKGGRHAFRRRSGKTTAILELCQEFGVENCIVIVPNSNFVWDMRRRVKDLGIRIVFARHVASLRGLGRKTRILIDELRLCDFQSQEWEFIRQYFDFWTATD